MAARKLSKHATKLLDEYAAAEQDHREWNNEHNVKRTRAALVAYIIQLETGVAQYVQAVYRREPWCKKRKLTP